jgi:tRNA-specific 2-thiouridylase
VYCNRVIKFGLLWEFAKKNGADYIATGHYARILKKNGKSVLYQAQHIAKDQSYVLSMIPRERLDHILLPLATQSKQETRKTAEHFGLQTHHKKDSQEICFIPGDDYITMLRQWRPNIGQPGEIIDTEGNILGRHEGIYCYTIGQRRGLGIALGKPAYVVRIDADSNTITLGGKKDLSSNQLRAEQVNWLIDPPSDPFPAKVKIRYNHAGDMATIIPCRDRQDEIRIIFDRPVLSITPGQTAVMYIADEKQWQVAGGGWIAEAIRE